MLAPVARSRSRSGRTLAVESDVSRPQSAYRNRLAAQRPANPITFCDGHGIGFVTVTGQILMAVHSSPLVTSAAVVIEAIRWAGGDRSPTIFASSVRNGGSYKHQFRDRQAARCGLERQGGAGGVAEHGR